MTADDHAAEVEALGRRYRGWTIWFGPFTRRWWALPPRERDLGAFVEAETPQRLIAEIEVIRRGPVRTSETPSGRRPLADPRQDARRPSNLLRLEGVTPSPSHRVPVIAWPGSTAR
ncbi:hypothetical protein [Actinomadura parmotrematis]|uniref:Uncharacterized protein n=1 Tax=Actinomadura parmotrematis TaxID=2864039 RepID=A0ABS7G0F3_9ACTN|nr:hypothetical protein [Actinomadura parmotrematis]MBW8485981.1 hypothetical protein [Actinomadura parmotrematis]